MDRHNAGKRYVMNKCVKPNAEGRQPLGWAMIVAFMCLPAASLANDPGKRDCLQDAKRLCAPEMNALSRNRVKACLIRNIDQTSPVCHATMLRLKAEHLAAAAQTKN